MKFLEFQGHLNADQTLTVPPAVAQQIKDEDSSRVVLLVPDEKENRRWSDLTAMQFLSGYAEGDAIHDRLSAGLISTSPGPC